MKAKTPFHMPNVREKPFGIEQMTSAEVFARLIGTSMDSCLLAELLTVSEKLPAMDVDLTSAHSIILGFLRFLGLEFSVLN